MRRGLLTIALTLAVAPALAGCSGCDGNPGGPDAQTDTALDTAPAILASVIYEGSQQNAQNAQLAIPITAAIPVGHRIVAAFTAGSAAGPVSCGDGANTYAIDAQLGVGGIRHVTCSAVVATALAPGSSIMLAYPQFSGASTAIAIELATASTALLDRSATASANNQAPAVGPTLITSQASEVLVATFSWGSTPMMTGPLTFDVVAAVDTDSGAATRNLIVALREVTTTDAFAVTGSLDVATVWTAALLTYPN